MRMIVTMTSSVPYVDIFSPLFAHRSIYEPAPTGTRTVVSGQLGARREICAADLLRMRPNVHSLTRSVSFAVTSTGGTG